MHFAVASLKKSFSCSCMSLSCIDAAVNFSVARFNIVYENIFFYFSRVINVCYVNFLRVCMSVKCVCTHDIKIHLNTLLSIYNFASINVVRVFSSCV